MPDISKGNIIPLDRNYFLPNEPIGLAKGIYPGRVVWMWDPDATNENCSNSSNNNGIIDSGDDAWFMSKNNDQDVIDTMIIKSLTGITGLADVQKAWDTIFKFFNLSHGYGNKGYTQGQKILIKINATSAYGGLASGRFNPDLGRTDNLAINDFASETNPYIVLSLLRQLINRASVPENMIYVGDPARNVYKEFYDLWHNEFPGVHVLGNNLLHNELNIITLGRTPVAVSTADKVFFSDHGSVMPDALTDKLFTIYDDIDYLINIPTMKAHSTAGITLVAKNHFGSFTREWAVHLHKGLMDNVDNPLRLGYGLYRVQTDIMMHKLLSGKNLLLIVDGLYPGEDALGVPFKWTSIPFNNDWCSSIFISLDPVAIESVCHDFLRTEYNGPTISESRPNWYGVDDYLHQAADSSLWPDNLIYDPDADGILFPSLGVHEHWNDSLNKKYTRNLGTGSGIELYQAHNHHPVFVKDLTKSYIQVYPNPTRNYLFIENQLCQLIDYQLTDFSGKVLLSGRIMNQPVTHLNLTPFNNGIYLLKFFSSGSKQNFKIIKKQ